MNLKNQPWKDHEWELFEPKTKGGVMSIEPELPGTLMNPPTEKIEPMSLPVGGKMRKGVLYRDEDETLFLFVAEESGALACWKLKIGENAMRATSECFVVPAMVLSHLWPGYIFTDPKAGH